MKCFSESIKIVCVCVVMLVQGHLHAFGAQRESLRNTVHFISKTGAFSVQSAPIRLDWVASWLANLMDPHVFAFQCYDYKFTLPPGNGGARL